jgi:hypothetical protein
MRLPAAKSSLEHQAPHAARRIQGTITVRATKRGFFDQHIKEVGAVFTIRADDMPNGKLPSWMELVPDETVTVDEPETDAQLETDAPKPPKAKGKKVEKAKPEPTAEPTPATKTDNDVL